MVQAGRLQPAAAAAKTDALAGFQSTPVVTVAMSATALRTKARTAGSTASCCAAIARARASTAAASLKPATSSCKTTLSQSGRLP